MKKILNESCLPIKTFMHNDIYRKFNKQFEYILNTYNYHNNDNIYVNNGDNKDGDYYGKKFDEFIKTDSNEIKFFVGNTGTGKSKFLSHYFGYKTFSCVKKEDSIIAPIGFNGVQGSDTDITKDYSLKVASVILDVVRLLYKSFIDFSDEELLGVYDTVLSFRNDLIHVSPQEIFANKDKTQIKRDALIKLYEEDCVTFACCVLKHVLLNSKPQNIKKIILIIDDLETLSEQKVCYIVTQYLKIFSCLQNIIQKNYVVKIIFSLRPHSYRFLNKGIAHEVLNIYELFGDRKGQVIRKDIIPNIKQVFLARFEDAVINTPYPGNKETWDEAYNSFKILINGIKNEYMDVIKNLCHYNIRAICACFQMILNNRVWCQNNNMPIDPHPTVKTGEYSFDIVNIIRTMSCGECPVYLGNKTVFPSISVDVDIQSAQSYDNSKIFIPNVLINLTNKECDVLLLLLIVFIKNYFEFNIYNSEDYYSVNRIKQDIQTCFTEVTEDVLNSNLKYLFENRIIRKSIISKDDVKSLNILYDDDFIYLTPKGEQIVSMFNADSVLLEVFREDIKREYIEPYDEVALTLIKDDKRDILFEDLIKLNEEIYYSEDKYFSNFKDKYNFSNKCFYISKTILSGIKKSLDRALSMESEKRDYLSEQINNLFDLFQKREKELGIK